MILSYKLEKFEGPLDLLLQLIEKNKINIYDIPIAKITEQYLQQIQLISSFDLNLSSEFLVMAATLIDIKARLLLPKEEIDKENEEDPRQDLVERLLEYKKYKKLALKLKSLQENAKNYIYKSESIPKEVLKYKEPIKINDLLKDVDLNKLEQIYSLLLKKIDDRLDKQRANFKNIKKERISLPDKINYIIKYIDKNKKFNFDKLLENKNSKSELVVTFLALLELMKFGKVSLNQEKTFSQIEVEVLEVDCEDFDMKTLEDL